MALEGSYPIIIDGEAVGSLTVTAQGARTAFCVRCRPMEGIVRISVYGGGTEGCLGVLAPEEGGMGLRKELSRTALKSFPQEIEAVSRSGGCIAPPEAPAPEPAVCTEPETPAASTASAVLPQTEQPAEGDAEELSWYSSPDGALVCFDGQSTLIALPAEDERIPADIPGVQRCIEGRDYLVFTTKNGNIVR